MGRLSQREQVYRRFVERRRQEDIDQEIKDVSFFVELDCTLEKCSSYLDCLRDKDLRQTLISLLVLSSQQFFDIVFFVEYVPLP